MENNNGKRELTQEEMNMIAGGNNEQQKTGLRCPGCGNPIPVTLEQIMKNKYVFCPTCGMRVSFDKRQTDIALEVLAKMEEQQRAVGK